MQEDCFQRFEKWIYADAPMFPPDGPYQPPAGHPDAPAWHAQHPNAANESQHKRIMERVRQRAVQIRATIAANLETAVCVVCSLRKCPAECTQQPLEQLPGLALLDVDGCKTARLPRHGHTTYEFRGVRYCLQPHAINVQDGVTTASVCKDCMLCLKRKPPQVPSDSLVAIDPGEPPAHLPKLNEMEETGIAALKEYIYLWMCTPTRTIPSHPERTQSTDERPVQHNTAYTGHMHAVRQPSAADWQKVIPCDPNDIPTRMQVRATFDVVARLYPSTLHVIRP